MADTPRPPTYDPVGQVKLPPRVTQPPNVVNVPDSPSGVHRLVDVVLADVSKMKSKARYKTYGMIGGALMTVFGGKVAYSKGETLETKHARLEEKHNAVVTTVENLTKRVDAGEAAQRKVERKVDRLEILLELELDQHGVPKSKRPPPVSEE